MVFIKNYNGAMMILASIGTGKIHGSFKSSWLQNLKYAMKTKTNPLGLDKEQRKQLLAKIKSVSGRHNNYSKTLKKYKSRDSPPLPANKNCGKTMKGNDGLFYTSQPNKNNVCSWKKKKFTLSPTKK